MVEITAAPPNLLPANDASGNGTAAAGPSHKYAPLVHASRTLVLFVVLALPSSCVVVAAVFALPLCATEGWSYGDSFLVVAQELSGATMDLTPHISGPPGDLGRIASGCVSLVSLGFFAVIFGVLGGSLVNPIYTVLTLTPDARSPKMRFFLLLFVGLPGCAGALSALFGIVLSALEGWNFQDSFFALLTELTTTNIPLGNTIAPSTSGAKVLVVVVSLWSLALFAVFLGVLGGPLAARAVHFDHTKQRSKLQCALIIISFSTMALPSLCLFNALLFTAIMSAVEQWPFEDTFWLIIASLSATNIPLTQAQLAPDSVFASIVAAYTGLVGVAVFSISLLIVGGELLMPFIKPLGITEKLPVARACKVMCFIIFGVMPVLSFAVSLVFGAVLATIEGWGVDDAFFVVFASFTACQVGIVELDEVKAQTAIGKLLIVSVNLWTLAIFAAVVGVISGKVALPILTELHLVMAEELESGHIADTCVADVVGKVGSTSPSHELSDEPQASACVASTVSEGPVVFDFSAPTAQTWGMVTFSDKGYPQDAVGTASVGVATEEAAAAAVAEAILDSGDPVAACPTEPFTLGEAKGFSATELAAEASTRYTAAQDSAFAESAEGVVGTLACEALPVDELSAAPGPREAAEVCSGHSAPSADAGSGADDASSENAPHEVAESPARLNSAANVEIDECLVQLWFEEHTSVMYHPVTGRSIPESAEEDEDEEDDGAAEGETSA